MALQMTNLYSRDNIVRATASEGTEALWEMRGRGYNNWNNSYRRDSDWDRGPRRDSERDQYPRRYPDGNQGSRYCNGDQRGQNRGSYQNQQRRWDWDQGRRGGTSYEGGGSQYRETNNRQGQNEYRQGN